MRSSLLFGVLLSMLATTAQSQTYYARERITSFRSSKASAPAKTMKCSSFDDAAWYDANASSVGSAAVTSEVDAMDWCRNRSNIKVSGICAYNGPNKTVSFVTGAQLVAGSVQGRMAASCTYG